MQRGHTRSALPFLHEINRILDQYKLWESLAPGRERQIRRMFHWAQIVAVDDIGESRRYLLKFRSPIKEDLGKLTVHKAAERINTDAQQLAELLRFASNPTRLRERDAAIAVSGKPFHNISGTVIEAMLSIRGLSVMGNSKQIPRRNR